MITPVLKTNNLEYLKEDSIFLEISKIDDFFYYFDLYFDFSPSLMLNDDILNVDFELIDNSLIPSQEFINSQLIKNNLPLENELDPEFFQNKTKVLNFKSSLLLNSIIFSKRFNVTNTIDNQNKFNNVITKKRLKIKNINVNDLKSYKNCYLTNDKLTINNFKDSIEYDFLYKTKEISSNYITFKESFKLEKSKLNSNLITFYLTLNRKFFSSILYKKTIDISDILNFKLQKEDFFINVKHYKDFNFIFVENNNNKIKILKNDLINNSITTVYDDFIDKDLKLYDSTLPIENVVYKVEYLESIKEFSISDKFNDYKCIIYCVNTLNGISVNVNIKNNLNNNFFILKKRNLTKKEKSYSDLGSIYKESFLFLDTDVSKNHIYEYAIFDNNDHKNQIASFIIERLNTGFKSSEFLIEKNIDEQDVQFKIYYNNSENNFISILKNFDLYDQYSSELLKNNQDIKKLFYYKIDRFDKNTNEFINLGWTSDTFSDKIFSKTLGIKEAEKNKQYLYFITAYNVNSIMFLNEDLKKIKNSDGREYLYDKNKWLQPLLIQNAISSDLKTRSNLYGKSDYEFGISSETIIVDVLMNDNKNLQFIDEISNLNLYRKYKNYITLEWNMNSVSNTDHLLLTKINDNSYEELICKIPVKFGKNSFLYKIDQNDDTIQLCITLISNELSFKDKKYFKAIGI